MYIIYVGGNEMNTREYIWKKNSDERYIFGVLEDIFIIYQSK